LSESEFGLLISMPVLSGAIGRLFLGIAAEQFGPRPMTLLTMLTSAASAWALSRADSFGWILAGALGVGLAGAVFITGTTFVARWYPRSRHGLAFGLFGLGQFGAAVTNFAGPLLLAAMGWHGAVQIYAASLVIAALLFWIFTRDDPTTRAQRAAGEHRTTLLEQIAPLRFLRVWRFSLYYFFAFGAFVALTSWLPRYYTGHFGMSLETAGMLTAVFSFSAAAFRAMGGWLSDRWGPRRVMYLTFIVSLTCLFVLSYPPTTYAVHGTRGLIEFHIAMPLGGFVALTFVLGFFMALGMAAVFKHIPDYYPDHVGSVGGMVGMIGALGGFVLPLVFGVLVEITAIWNAAFMILFALVAVNLTWMHFAIARMERRVYPGLKTLRDLPEAIPVGTSAHGAVQTGSGDPT